MRGALRKEYFMSIFSGLARLLGVLSPAHITLVTLASGARKVGVDPAGNKYYSASPRRGYRRDRRWVIYNGAPEASKVPPEWHGWLHHQTDAVPAEEGPSYRRPWQQPYVQNLTGTAEAYRPQGHLLSGGPRAKASGDYEAWRPANAAPAAAAPAKAAAKPAAKAKKTKAKARSAKAPAARKGKARAGGKAAAKSKSS
jgi:NADH:ubiquinone oxidoreductase subunit